MDRVGSLELNRTGFSVAEAEVSRELTEDEKRRIGCRHDRITLGDGSGATARQVLLTQPAAAMTGV